MNVSVYVLVALTLNSLWLEHGPVVVLMRAVDPQREGQTVTARVVGIKLRGCELQFGNEVGYFKGANGWAETPVRFVDDPVPGNSRPAGMFLQDFGVWEWSSVPAIYSDVQLSAVHICGARTKTTRIGPFRVPPIGN